MGGIEGSAWSKSHEKGKIAVGLGNDVVGMFCELIFLEFHLAHLE